MYNSLTILIAKVLNFFAKILCKILKKDNGNMLGRIVKKLNPNILEYLKIDCPVIAVTATNGKTTTNNCIRYIIENNGKKVVSNKEGNNMETGIITTLIKNCTISGKIKADYICLEVDESYIPIVFKKIRLDTLLVLNFFRDQLDRNGEVESLILKIENFLKTYNGNLILNNDDPNVARLGQANKENKNVYYFSVEKYENASIKQKEAGEGKFCPFDKTKLEYEYYQYSHVGKYICPTCNFGNVELFTKIKNVDLENMTFDENEIHYNTQANNIYTIYNFAGAISVAKIYNLDAKKSLETFKLNNGRSEEISINGIKTFINLAKNPTGANVSLRTLNENKEEKELLFVLNDNPADGLDVSWIWDINFELNNVSRVITSGKRAYDMAIRIKTSGFDENKIEAYTNIDEAVKSLYKTEVKKYVIANYTALQPTRRTIFSNK